MKSALALLAFLLVLPVTAGQPVAGGLPVVCLDSVNTCVDPNFCVPVAHVCSELAPSCLDDVDCQTPPVCAAVSDCCGQTFVSEPGDSTIWSYPYANDGASGFNQPSVGVDAADGWATIPGAQFIWKDAEETETYHGLYDVGVVFTREFVSCSLTPEPLHIQMNADNSYRFQFNDAAVVACGVPGVHSECYTDVQTYHFVAKPFPEVNTVSWMVYNAGGPAMLQYRIDI
jgi:hypothetical protein